MIEIAQKDSYRVCKELIELCVSVARETETDDYSEYPKVRPWEEIVFAKDENEIVGFIQYFVAGGVVTISHSGVKERFRKGTLYSDMYHFLRFQSIDAGLSAIVGFTDEDNTEMLKFSNSQNMDRVHIIKMIDEL